MTPGRAPASFTIEQIVYAARTLRATAAPSATSTKSNNSFFTMASSTGW
jgi:hypothetical protein